ncbi:helix-turn-helix domain-containing protein [Streptomyces beigongshangae]|uniref:helix-turn-helix domain-containing protein n=1 Tax=Streptomyces beigongshangae TaxID=2841597 RepID=UPI001C8488AB|nr:helix-turn-helix transcriptional regulator [Streptomyces sp. REN17]
MSPHSRTRTAEGTLRPARSVPSADPARASRCTEALRDIAEDCNVVSEALLLSAYSAAPPNDDLLQHLVSLQNLVEEAIGAVVVRQRTQGEPLADLAPIVKRTEDRLRKKYDPLLVDRALATRHRPKPATPAHHTTATTGTPTLRQPRQRLASALTLMRNGSGRRQRELAEQMGVHESYISRMLSGQRDLSWRHVRIICEACEFDPELMKPLWEVAAGVQPSNADHPVQYLRTYLRGLHYAFGSPKPGVALAAAQHALSADDLHRALHGPGVPDWPVIEQLTIALQSLPNITRPLWRRAQRAAENGPTTI